MMTTTYTCPNPTWCTTNHADESHGEHLCDSNSQVLCVDNSGKPVTAGLTDWVIDAGTFDNWGPVPGAGGPPRTHVYLQGTDDLRRMQLDIDPDQLRTLVAGLQELERQLGSR